MVSRVEAQEPLLTTHSIEFIPMAKPVTVDVGLVFEVTVEPPVNTFQIPFPIAGTMPVRVELVEHIFWSVPAFAADGFASTFIKIVSRLDGQTPLLTTHSILLSPIVNPPTVEVALVFVVTTEPPVKTFHIPVPIAGLVAAKV